MASEDPEQGKEKKDYGKWSKYMEAPSDEVTLGDDNNKTASKAASLDDESKDRSLQRAQSSRRNSKKQTNEPKVKNEGTCGWLWDILEDQDNIQKIMVLVKIVLELYRVVISSFLLLFVPQLCPARNENDSPHLCSLEENAELGTEGSLYDAGFSLNCVTLIAFVIMYVAEYHRETKLINYLDVNSNLKFDNASVEKQLEKLPKDKWEEILTADTIYKWAGSFALLCFLTNCFLSGVVISEYYMGDKTAVNFITSVLFMITKMNVVRATIRTEKFVLPSAYLTVQTQFNDIEAD